MIMPDGEPRLLTTRSLRGAGAGLGRPSVRTTFQLAAKVLTRPGGKQTDVFQGAAREVLGWLKHKCPDDLPEEAWRGESFSCGVPGHNVECASIPDEGVWSLRLVHPDTPFGDREAVPGRTWTTEVSLRQGEEAVRLGVRVLCTSQAYSEGNIALTRPRFVLDLARHFVLQEVRQIEDRPWLLRNERDLDDLYALLTNPARTMPVFLLTEVDRRQMHVPVSDYVLEPIDLARRLEGLAYVAVMPSRLTFAWTDRVGKVWSAFLGAVRTYRPGLDFDEDSPTQHPLTLAKNILFWRHGGLQAEDAFTAFLVDQSYQHAATKRVDWGGCLFFADAQMRRTQRAKEEASEEADWRGIYEAEVTALREKVSEAEKERDEALDLAEQAEKDRDLYIGENDRLRWQIDSLRERLAEKTGEDIDTTVEIPQDYEDLPQWVEENLLGRLVLHPRALRGVKDAQYEDAGLVFRSLLLLANEYRNMRLGLADAREAFEAKMAELGLRCSGSISESRAGEEGDTYFVRYPLHADRKRFLELHLRKGSTRDDRHCLAVYFFWDEETRQVVVGWLPSHLENRMT